jgi:hypothetical protein
MNRHERRKAAARQRQGKPLLVTWKMDDEGKARARAMTEGNPAFVASVDPLANLYIEWRKAHPRARLAWHPTGEAFIVGALASPLMQQSYADSPDAFELLAWLAERMPEADVMAARCAIEATDERVSEWMAERTKHTSAGLQLVEVFARSTGTTTRTPEAPCPHCGTVMGAASAGDDAVPSPGMLVVCVRCGGIGCFDDELHPRLMTDAEWAELPPEIKTKLEDAGAILRHVRARGMSGSKGQVDA